MLDSLCGTVFSGKVSPFFCLLQIKGEAEAFAVEAKGRAEAEQMAKKADAFQQYKDGAMVDMLLEKLPLVRDNIPCICHSYLIYSLLFFYASQVNVGSFCLGYKIISGFHLLSS